MAGKQFFAKLSEPFTRAENYAGRKLSAAAEYLNQRPMLKAGVLTGAGAGALITGVVGGTDFTARRNKEAIKKLEEELFITKVKLADQEISQGLIRDFSPETMENYDFLQYSTLPAETKELVDYKSSLANVDPQTVYDTAVPWQFKVGGADAVEALLKSEEIRPDASGYGFILVDPQVPERLLFN